MIGLHPIDEAMLSKLLRGDQNFSARAGDPQVQRGERPKSPLPKHVRKARRKRRKEQKRARRQGRGRG